MNKKSLTYFALLLLLFLGNSSGDSPSSGADNVPTGFSPGPDIIAGNMADLAVYGVTGTQRGLAIGITSCNAGDQFVGFFAMPNTDHPAVAQNLYRLSGGSSNDERFEQIGQSWVKHTYGAKQANSCSFGCQPGGDFTHLGVGCSDTYFSSQSAEQSDLGSRAWINPFTGLFPSTARDHTGHNHTAVSHMILTEDADLNPAMNPGANYYAELLYVTPNEYAWCQDHMGECNMYNNASYRRYSISGTTSYTFTAVGSTVRMTAGIYAWPGATVTQIEPAPGVDGCAYLAYRVTGPVGGIYHYEYAIYNLNLDRGIQSFTVPRLLLPGVELPETNVGFHAPPQHPGFPNDGTQGDAGFSGAEWAFNATSFSLTWSSETLAQNQNANAIRWGTLYNFRFDSPTEPATSNATIGFFKTGASITVPIQGPAPIGGPSPTPVSPTPTPTATPTVTPTASPTATPCVGNIFFEENFDDVNPPGLPTGWINGPGCWVISNVDPDTPPNDAFCPDPAEISDCRLDLPVILPSGPAVLSFRNNFKTEYHDLIYWDGGVLEVSSPNISGGEFLDVTDSHVGGTIIEGGYTSEISGNANNPLAGRLAWCGDSHGYVTTVVKLGPNLAGQSITLRWRFGSDGKGSAVGWRIDTIRISDGTCPPTPTPSPTPTPCIGTVLEENFDNVVPPALPPGWTSAAGCWVTSNVNPDTPPNALYCPGIDGVSNCTLDKIVSLPSDPAVLSFRNNFNFELSDGFCRDYGVLEVSAPNISGGEFLDVTDSHIGGVIVGGGYTCEIDSGPFAGRLVWGGNSNGYFSTIVNLGPNLAGQTVTLRWRAVSDEAVSSPGWLVDTVRITGGSCSPTPTPTTTPLPTPSVTPTPTTPPVVKAVNLSTRLQVQPGEGAGIAGFIASGSGMSVLARGIGPSLSSTGIPDPLADPILSVYVATLLAATNDNWRDSQEADIIATGLQPTNDLESAILFAVSGTGGYTVRLTGHDTTSGVGLVEIYDLGKEPDETLGNISTRAQVGTGNHLAIGGFIITGANGSAHIVVRGIGPSLASFGVQNPLSDPMLELRSSDGTLLVSNDNWQDDSFVSATLTATGLALSDSVEAGLAVTLSPGAYTAILSGHDETTGVGLIEIYNNPVGFSDPTPTPTPTSAPNPKPSR